MKFSDNQTVLNYLRLFNQDKACEEIFKTMCFHGMTQFTDPRNLQVALIGEGPQPIYDMLKDAKIAEEITSKIMKEVFAVYEYYLISDNWYQMTYEQQLLSFDNVCENFADSNADILSIAIGVGTYTDQIFPSWLKKCNKTIQHQAVDVRFFAKDNDCDSFAETHGFLKKSEKEYVSKEGGKGASGDTGLTKKVLSALAPKVDASQPLSPNTSPNTTENGLPSEISPEAHGEKRVLLHKKTYFPVNLMISKSPISEYFYEKFKCVIEDKLQKGKDVVLGYHVGGLNIDPLIVRLYNELKDTGSGRLFLHVTGGSSGSLWYGNKQPIDFLQHHAAYAGQSTLTEPSFDGKISIHLLLQEITEVSSSKAFLKDNGMPLSMKITEVVASLNNSHALRSPQAIESTPQVSGNPNCFFSGKPQDDVVLSRGKKPVD